MKKMFWVVLVSVVLAGEAFFLNAILQHEKAILEIKKVVAVNVKRVDQNFMVLRAALDQNGIVIPVNEGPKEAPKPVEKPKA
jgi:hypothetical protein